MTLLQRKKTAPRAEAKVTLNTTAQHLGLTPGTVSAALNNSAAARSIPAHTKNRIIVGFASLYTHPVEEIAALEFQLPMRAQNTRILGTEKSPCHGGVFLFGGCFLVAAPARTRPRVFLRGLAGLSGPPPRFFQMFSGGFLGLSGTGNENCDSEQRRPRHRSHGKKEPTKPHLNYHQKRLPETPSFGARESTIPEITLA